MKRHNSPDRWDWLFVSMVVVVVLCLAYTFYLTRKEIHECRLTNPMSLLPADCGPKRKPKVDPSIPPVSGSAPNATTTGSELPRQE